MRIPILGAVLCFACSLALAGCHEPNPGAQPQFEAGKIDLKLNVQNVIVGKPSVIPGINSITISWPNQQAGSLKFALQLKWNAIPGAVAYEVFRSADSGGSFKILGAVSDLELLDQDVEALAVYEYYIKAVLDSGDTQISPTISAQVADKKDSVLGFNVYRSRTVEGPYYMINPKIITGDIFLDNDLPADSTYYYKVSVVFTHDVPGAQPEQYMAANEVLFDSLIWGKTWPAKPTSLSLGIYPCTHGYGFLGTRFVVRAYDQNGDIIRWLGKNNFSVEEDGSLVPIKHVFPVLPWGMQVGGIVMDYSGSMYAAKTDIPLMQNMLISGMIGAKSFWDRYEIVKYDTKIIPYALFTTSLSKLINAIKTLSHKFSGATAFYDALEKALKDTDAQHLPIPLLDNLFHKKFAIGFTDGEENSSKLKADDLIKSARNKCVPIYAVGYDGQITSPGIKKLLNLTDNTGGTTFLAKQSSTGLFEKISKIVDNGYFITIPTINAPTGPHKVKITLNYQGLTKSKTVTMTY